MSRYKCFQCSRKKHTFKDCAEATCSCLCVNELFSLPKNELLDEISKSAPRFLHVRNEEIPNLLYPYKQMNHFMRVRVKEQIIGKIDRRIKETY